MSRADLVTDLKASLLDAGRAFTAAADADFVRHLDKAAQAMTRARRRTQAGTLMLEAGRADYAAPADLWLFKTTTWGAAHGLRPWEPGYPGRLPDVRLIDGVLWFVPAPSAQQIAVLGAACPFFYYARLAVADAANDTTVAADDRGLLLLRAQAEAMRELALRDSVRPTGVQSAWSGQPKTGTPAALAQWLLGEFERAARAD